MSEKEILDPEDYDTVAVNCTECQVEIRYKRGHGEGVQRVKDRPFCGRCLNAAIYSVEFPRVSNDLRSAGQASKIMKHYN